MQKPLPKIAEVIMLILGDPCAEKLTLIYAEFERWREILDTEFTVLIATRVNCYRSLR
jgi:hypothetical protein